MHERHNVLNCICAESLLSVACALVPDVPVTTVGGGIVGVFGFSIRNEAVALYYTYK